MNVAENQRMKLENCEENWEISENGDKRVQHLAHVQLESRAPGSGRRRFIRDEIIFFLKHIKQQASHLKYENIFKK